MPVIKSAKKQMKQSAVKKSRNLSMRSKMKTMIKKEFLFIKEGKIEEAVKLLPQVYSTIDTACKKNIIHRNNAARKKSRLAVALSGASGKAKAA